MKNELMLYIHIPFCVRKCNYCDFLSFGQDFIGARLDKDDSVDTVYDKYIEALVNEIKDKSNHYKDYIVTSIFIGGGTPSVLEGYHIEQLFETLRYAFSINETAEITIECNPGTLTKDKLLSYKKSGINRLSIGLQSANDNELERLGRIHSYEDFLNNYNLAREIGFSNINIDLISSIPDQTIDSFENSLKKVINLKPEHISSYSLIIEEGTPFYSFDEKKLNLPSEEDERTIYYSCREILGNSGYHQYEISNYALAGKECKHNLGYWERKNYLGLGLGSSSLVNDVRWKNSNNLYMYLDKQYSIEDEESLTKEDAMSEFMFLGLRKTEGVSLTLFEELFNNSIMDTYDEWTRKMLDEKLLLEDNGFLKLTYKGMDLANYVMSGYV